MPTLFPFTPSSADHTAPEKLSYREIARSAGNEIRESGAGVKRAPIRPFPFLRPVRVNGYGGFVQCGKNPENVHNFAQWKNLCRCQIPDNPHKSLLLRRNWLRSTKPRATRPNPCPSATPHGPKSNGPGIRILSPKRSSFFRCPKIPGKPALPGCLTQGAINHPEIRAQFCTMEKSLYAAEARITRTIIVT